MLTVVIPTYNRIDLTDNAINSIICESPSLIKIIVVDDCGTTPYTHSNENASGIKVSVIQLDKNVGAGMARKFGVEYADSQYISFLDSDDSYDPEWLNYVLELLQKQNPNEMIFISGITQGEKKYAGLIRKLIAEFPFKKQLFATRIIVTQFNPFYTPSIVMSKDLCTFKEGLRYCEDYYTNAFALFFAHKIYLPPITACHLGRTPNSLGGVSAEKTKMHQGELIVRWDLLTTNKLTIMYKILILVGMCYQLTRMLIKSFLEKIQ